jgi:hypothetical protein
LNLKCREEGEKGGRWKPFGVAVIFEEHCRSSTDSFGPTNYTSGRERVVKMNSHLCTVWVSHEVVFQWNSVIGTTSLRSDSLV